MAITPLPTPPSREDPNNFAERADALLAALVTFVTECNAMAATVDAQSTSATASAATATTKAGDAAAARDIAMAAVAYKGAWSSLSGALAIPASAYHGGNIYILTESVANVALETPGVSSKWFNVTPASGLGSAAYQPSSAFQPAIGAITALLKSTGSGNIAGASAADIVAAIGATAVQNATNAATAATVTTLPDGAVSAAAKIANGIITWAKMANMNTGKLIGRSTAGGGAPEEIGIGSGLEISGGNLVSTGAPAGMLAPFAGSAAPSGWMLCHGQAISRASFSALFSAIGTTYGAGDGSSTFNLPDLRGRVVAGKDDMGGSAASRLTSPVAGATLGATGGAQSHTLSTSEMPSHSHGISPAYLAAGAGVQSNIQYFNGEQAYTASASTGSAGSGASHNNVQPTIVLNYIIKT